MLVSPFSVDILVARILVIKQLFGLKSIAMATEATVERRKFASVAATGRR